MRSIASTGGIKFEFISPAPPFGLAALEFTLLPSMRTSVCEPSMPRIEIPLAGPSSPPITLTPGAFEAMLCNEVKLSFLRSSPFITVMLAGAFLILCEKPLAVTTTSSKFILSAACKFIAHTRETIGAKALFFETII